MLSEINQSRKDKYCMILLYEGLGGGGGGLVTRLCLTLTTPWTLASQASLSMGFPRLLRILKWLPCPFPV